MKTGNQHKRSIFSTDKRESQAPHVAEFLKLLKTKQGFLSCRTTSHL